MSETQESLNDMKRQYGREKVMLQDDNSKLQKEIDQVSLQMFCIVCINAPGELHFVRGGGG